MSTGAVESLLNLRFVPFPNLGPRYFCTGPLFTCDGPRPVRHTRGVAQPIGRGFAPPVPDATVFVEGVNYE